MYSDTLPRVNFAAIARMWRISSGFTRQGMTILRAFGLSGLFLYAFFAFPVFFSLLAHMFSVFLFPQTISSQYALSV